MTRINNIVWFKDSITAWENINEMFLRQDYELRATLHSHALYVYDYTIGIRKPKLDPDFDFGRHFNYTMAKWKSLVSNYIDFTELKAIKEEVQAEESKSKSRIYNLALQFTNKHGHGKNCLLSMVFSRRANESKPTINIFLRASEVTKRLVCDLLLFQRIGEYIYGDTEFQLIIHFNQMFNDDTVLLMYHAHKSIKSILRESTSERSKELLETLKKLLKKDPSEIKYKVHRRAAKVLRPDICKYPKTLAKDCKL